jgi:hypothetical protein
MERWHTRSGKWAFEVRAKDTQVGSNSVLSCDQTCCKMSGSIAWTFSSVASLCCLFEWRSSMDFSCARLFIAPNSCMEKEFVDVGLQTFCRM